MYFQIACFLLLLRYFYEARGCCEKLGIFFELELKIILLIFGFIIWDHVKDLLGKIRSETEFLGNLRFANLQTSGRSLKVNQGCKTD